MTLGLHNAAGYYYYPGFHEPGTNNAVGINKAVWESFDASDRRVIEAVAACEYARSLAEFNANNALSLRKLRDEGTVKILKFDDSLLEAFLAISKDVVAEIGAGDELSKKIYQSYEQFRASIMDWRPTRARRGHSGSCSPWRENALSRSNDDLVCVHTWCPPVSRGARRCRDQPPSLRGSWLHTALESGPGCCSA
jgi:hypothetical protein